ncbi:hypothetical protein JK203_03585 [Gluconobacter cerinus]|uniref:hypothetical protein n=1 Tax=Gluconobacter cerinus TaxID=38307 RepID=UPI001B8D2F06|nr:hypothetical protein [Gluconobacter cerinus]MBS1039932.1 hypothetical protein [Gluconobacter cerinus]MBS1045893.1 hypothetical protein [Gluconobacter cerinus]
MNKVICAAASLISFVLGFVLFGYITVKWGQNTDKWGDLATWTGSGVAFLALMAAICAAILSKQSSDKQNENSTIVSFMSLSKENANYINEKYYSMTKEVDNFFQENIDGYMSEEYNKDQSFFSVCKILVENSGECLSIISRTIFIINESRIPKKLKQALVREFFFSMSSYFISECLFHNHSKIFFTFNDQKNSIESWISSYIENIQTIQKIIVENGLFPDRVQLARKNGSLYPD